MNWEEIDLYEEKNEFNWFKLIFLVLEITALLCIGFLAFTEVREDAEMFKNIFTIEFALLAVAMQKEFDNLEWFEND